MEQFLLNFFLMKEDILIIAWKMLYKKKNKKKCKALSALSIYQQLSLGQ